MPTKPEGPAQEPQSCMVCDNMRRSMGDDAIEPTAIVEYETTGHFPNIHHPATPAPSQPRDWLSAIREVLTSDKSDAAKLIAVGILASSSEPLTEAEIKRGWQVWNEHGAPSQSAASTSRTEWGARYSMGLRCQKCAQPLADNNKNGFCSAHKKYQSAAKGSTAPSQPAGAREDDAEELYRVSRRGFEQFKVALATFLAQQTAAKDAEIAELKRDIESDFMQGAYARLKALQAAERELAELRQSFEVEAERRFQYFCEHRMKAAERERDSLREALKLCQSHRNEMADYVKSIEAKDGKEPCYHCNLGDRPVNGLHANHNMDGEFVSYDKCAALKAEKKGQK